MNSGVPSTLRTLPFRCTVLSPRSPIRKSPEVPLMKIFSHFKSRWITGGSCEWRYSKPFRIWNAHRFAIFQRITCTLLIKLFKVPDDNISVTKLTSCLSRLTHEPWKLIIFWWCNRSSNRTSLTIRFRSAFGTPERLTTFQATSIPSWVS